MDHDADPNGELMVLTDVCQALVQAVTPGEIRDLRDKAEAVRRYAKSAAKGLLVQNRAAELRLRAERKGGALLRHMNLWGGDRRSRSHDEILKLEAMGIDRNQSHRWQLLASIPDDVFEAYIRECNQLLREITGNSLVRFARQRVQCSIAKDIDKEPAKATNVAGRLSQLIALHKSFACICIYPPWPGRRKLPSETNGHQLDRRFISRMEKLPVNEVAAVNAHLHLWTTSERLDDAIRLFDAWGFAYGSVLVCVKPVREYGPFYRAGEDFLLLGTKGNLAFRVNDVASLIEADGHWFSGVADSVRDLIERVSPGPYLEVFGGTAHLGWTVVN